MTFSDLIANGLKLTLIMTVAICCISGIKARISPSPTLPWVRRKVMRLLTDRLALGGSHKMVELGMGWGGLAVKFSTTFPKSQVTGFEISMLPYIVSSLRSLLFKGRIHVHHRDFFDEDLSSYNVVVCYLSPYHMARLGPQLATLAPGSLIVSNAFPILDRIAIETLETNVGVKIPIYLYKTA